MVEVISISQNVNKEKRLFSFVYDVLIGVLSTDNVPMTKKEFAMANQKGTAEGWPSLVTHVYRVIKNACSVASWNSLPWILGMSLLKLLDVTKTKWKDHQLLCVVVLVYICEVN